MSTNKKRIKAIQALVAGSVVASAPILCSAIQNELSEVYRVDRVKPLQRRRLLQVLHSTRALDSFLGQFTDHHGCRGNSGSLGQYLQQLTNHRVRGIRQLNQAKRTHFQRNIVDKRNKYMHEAGAFPTNDGEIIRLLAEMQNCLVEIVNL